MKTYACILFACIFVTLVGIVLAFTQPVEASEACWPSYETPCTV